MHFMCTWAIPFFNIIKLVTHPKKKKQKNPLEKGKWMEGAS